MDHLLFFQLLGNNQGSLRYLAPGGLTLKILKIQGGGGGKLVRFNGQFLAKFPKFCLKFFFNKNHNFFKDFCRNSIEISKGRPKEMFLRNISEFSPKNFLWSPL